MSSWRVGRIRWQQDGARQPWTASVGGAELSVTKWSGDAWQLLDSTQPGPSVWRSCTQAMNEADRRHGGQAMAALAPSQRDRVDPVATIRVGAAVDATEAALRQACLDEIERCYAQARAKWPNVSFPTPEVTFNLVGVRAGVAESATAPRLVRKIRLNRELLVRYGQRFVKDTAGHEAAHLLTYDLHGQSRFGRKVWAHGTEWQQMMRFLGLDPSRCHDFDVSRHRSPRPYLYACGCPTETGVTAYIHGKIQAGTPYSCRRCKRRLTFTRIAA